MPVVSTIHGSNLYDTRPFGVVKDTQLSRLFLPLANATALSVALHALTNSPLASSARPGCSPWEPNRGAEERRVAGDPLLGALRAW